MHGGRIIGWLGVLVGSLIMLGCASGGRVAAPEITMPVAPTIRFLNFNSISIQPEGIQFEAKVKIENKMPVTLPLDRIEYQFDLNHKRLMSGTFSEFAACDGYGSQVVTFPFLIAWEDLVLHAVAKNEEPCYTASFNGTLYINGGYAFAEIPFSLDKVLPVPAWPEVAFAGTEGSPLGEKFAITFNVKNGNHFPIWLDAVNTSLVLNNKKYNLVHGRELPRLEAGETQPVTLGMYNTLGKGISMFANVLISGKADFKIGGRLRFGTPFGYLYLPLEYQGSSN